MPDYELAKSLLSEYLESSDSDPRVKILSELAAWLHGSKKVEMLIAVRKGAAISQDGKTVTFEINGRERGHIFESLLLDSNASQSLRMVIEKYSSDGPFKWPAATADIFAIYSGISPEAALS